MNDEAIVKTLLNNHGLEQNQTMDEIAVETVRAMKRADQELHTLRLMFFSVTPLAKILEYREVCARIMAKEGFQDIDRAYKVFIYAMWSNFDNHINLADISKNQIHNMLGVLASETEAPWEAFRAPSEPNSPDGE